MKEIIDFLKLLYQRKLFLISIPIITMIASFFIGRTLPDIYVAHARIATGIVDQGERLITDGSRSDPQSINQEFENLIQLMGLKMIVNQVSYKLMLHDLTTDIAFRERSSLLKKYSDSQIDSIIRLLQRKYEKQEELSAWNKQEKELLECISLIAMPFVRPMRKIVLAIGAVLFFVTMLYSGTRSAYVLVPAALVLLAIFRYNRITLIVSAIAGVCALILIYMPTDEPLLLRFQTAFRPSEDASFNVRKINQRLIQPYLQSHPLGGGLGSTGVWGQRFSPNTFLANFPPDSGYVRVAVELGWVGLLIFCSMMFVFLRTGINNYYLIKDPELKSYCMAMVLVLFALNIANYPQEALVQFPTSILFVMAAATVQVCYRLDREKQNVNFYQTSIKS